MDGIGVIPLSETSEVVFYVDNYKGRLSANIRKFIKSRKYTGPTTSGIKLTADQLSRIRDALTDLSCDLQDVHEQQLITIPTGTSSYIAACISLFNGQYGLDIRQYISTEKYKGPSKKGVRIPLYRLQEAVSYCDKMLVTLERVERDSTLFGSHEQESQTQPTETQNENKKVEGVPDEFQRFFE